MPVYNCVTSLLSIKYNDSIRAFSDMQILGTISTLTTFLRKLPEDIMQQ